MERQTTMLGRILLMTALLAIVTRAEDPRQKQPNIVFVLADDFGFHDIGYHGSEIQTPVLDKLAASGVKLENYYVQPICSPTRSQLMSGRHQIHTGLQHGIILNCQDHGLPVDEMTIADKLKEVGYSTHMIGKWHLGDSREVYMPWKRGFDSYYGYLVGLEDYFNHTVPYNDKYYLDLRANDMPDKKQDGHYSAHLFTDKAKDVINSHNTEKPLFLYMAYQSVHKPMQVPDRYLEKYRHIKDDNRRYYAGELVHTCLEYTMVAKFTLEETTILCVVGNIHYGKEVCIGVGFVAGGALKVSGVVNRELIHVSDWFPTLVGLAGGNLNGTKPLDGFDQWETICKDSPSKRQILLHNIDPLTKPVGKRLFDDTFDNTVRAAIRIGEFKLITGDPYNGSWIAPPDADQHVTPAMIDPPDKNIWVFNIAKDPNEYNDLSEAYPDMVRWMLDVLKTFNDTAVPALFPPEDPKCNPALHGGVWGPWL